MKKQTFSTLHPMVIFWMGLMTGALIVGLLFFYKSISSVDYQSSLFRSYTPISTDLYKTYDTIRYYDSGSTSLIAPSTYDAAETISVGVPPGS